MTRRRQLLSQPPSLPGPLLLLLLLMLQPASIIWSLFTATYWMCKNLGAILGQETSSLTNFLGAKHLPYSTQHTTHHHIAFDEVIHVPFTPDLVS